MCRRRIGTYLIVISPTPQSNPSRINSFQKAPLLGNCQPVISGLCESWAESDLSGMSPGHEERREEVSSASASGVPACVNGMSGTCVHGKEDAGSREMLTWLAMVTVLAALSVVS